MVGELRSRDCYAGMCVIAWNAWRSGSKTNLAYHPDAKLPSVK
jgi:hypothetical protein